MIFNFIKYIFVFFCFCYLNLKAQNKLDVKTGALGNYIINPIRLSATNIDLKFEIFRANASQNNFEKIKEFSFPKTAIEFNKNIKAAYENGIYEQSLNNDEITKCWTKWQRFQTLDSINKYFNYLQVLFGFNTLLIDNKAEPNIKYIYKFKTSEGKEFISSPISFPSIAQHDKTYSKSYVIDNAVLYIDFKSHKKLKKPHHFLIYRQEVGSNIPFQKMGVSYNITTKNDSFYFSFSDENTSNSKSFFYYIVTCDQLGNQSNPSDTMFATSFELNETMVPQNVKAISDNETDQLRIRWDFTNPFSIGSIEIYRSLKYDSNYVKIASINSYDTSYIDKGLMEGIKYYYYLKVFDKLGRKSINGARFFGITGKGDKPESVSLFFIESNSKEIILKWVPNGNNIRGYRLFKTYEVDGKLVPVGNFIAHNINSKEYKYYDTSNLFSITGTIGYTIIQENFAYQESEIYPIQYVKSPFQIKSNNMLSFGVTRLGNTFYLNWASINQIQSDGYYIYREIDGKMEKINKDLLPSFRSQFKDSINDKYQKIKYYISSVNNGIESKKIPSEEFAPICNPQSPYNLIITNQNNQIILNWDYYKNLNVDYFYVYAFNPGSEPIKIGETKGELNSYKTNEKYSNYYIVAVLICDNKNISSEPSEVINYE